MNTRTSAPKDPLFDVGIIRNHINVDWLGQTIRDTMKRHEAGEKLYFNDQLPRQEEFGTDVAFLNALPVLEFHEDLREKLLAILCDIRKEGILKPIVNGVGRNIPAVDVWNRFVEQGADELSDFEIVQLLKTPLPSAIYGALSFSARRKIRDLRKENGLAAFAASNVKPDENASPSGRPMPVDEAMFDAVVASAIDVAYAIANGEKRFLHTIEHIHCRKTDAVLQWSSDRLLDPALGISSYEKVDGKTSCKFTLVEPYVDAQPIRHIQVKTASGIMLMADWFRIPGFVEGVNQSLCEDYSKPSINSDLGVDLRTQDHFERLGLLRIHTTNSMPAIIKDGQMIRVGIYNEDHECLWMKDPENPENMIRKPDGAGVIEPIGNLCCDLWDVTFADREVLVDILVEGGRILAENGCFDDSGNKFKNAPGNREEAYALLDEYEKSNFVTRLQFEPGQTLHLYMGTGRDVAIFSENFKSPDVAERPYLEDMFILSQTELSVNPDILEEPQWKQGGRTEYDMEETAYDLW